MPDITKCRGEGCPLKEQCWRFVCKPALLRQSRWSGTPYDPVTKTCLYLWEVHDE